MVAIVLCAVGTSQNRNTASIEGSVYRINQPEAQATMTLYRKPQDEKAAPVTLSKTDGTFRWENVESGEYYVEAQSPFGRGSSTAIVKGSSGWLIPEKTIQIAPGLRADFRGALPILALAALSGPGEAGMPLPFPAPEQNPCQTEKPEDAALYGRIVDVGTHTPLENFSVELVRLGGGGRVAALAKPKGCYVLAAAKLEEKVKLEEKASYVLLVRQEGYRDLLIPVTVTNGRLSVYAPDPFEFSMERTGGALDEDLRLLESPARRYSFPGRFLELVPLRGSRNFDALALLLPGVAPAPEVAQSVGPGISPAFGSPGQFAIHGLRRATTTSL